MSKSFSISEYKFEQVQDYSKVVVVVNFTLFAIFLSRGLDYVSSNPYTLNSLFSGLIMLLVIFIYNWRSSSINLISIGLFSLLVAYEFWYFGIPSDFVTPNSHEISKGILLDLFLGLLPYIYFGLRCLSILCLIPIWWHSRRLID